MLKMNDLKWLHLMRQDELNVALKKFPKGKNIKILELGGGDGYIAKCLAEQNYDIISTDINPKFPSMFPVRKIIDEKLDFSPETFDLIFTSQVIAHVENLELFFDEVKKVLKKDGLMINLVPSTGWWIITNFWHYVLTPYNFLKFLKKSNIKNNQGESNIKKTEINLIKRIINYLFLHPLGNSSSFIYELKKFSKNSWIQLFKKYQFKIVEIDKSTYSYSGYFVLKMKLMNFRKIISKYILPTTYCFVLQKV
jgi:SAM-dependent methyltransferase|tara:strand:+ start:57 stop:812 length:756 start_codon:yes stop_codon:yes gene_type:complete